METAQQILWNQVRADADFYIDVIRQLRRHAADLNKAMKPPRDVRLVMDINYKIKELLRDVATEHLNMDGPDHEFECDECGNVVSWTL
jgi:hypothetical protein